MKQNITTIARDENCDLYVDADGNIALVEGKEAYAQIINAKMRTSLGEMQLSMEKGVPYFQTVFANRSMIPVWQKEVEKMITAIDFVKKITVFDCQYDADVLKYTMEIETDKGTVTING